ncbi:MAG: SGNH/GDSL hydrolase family protein [Candidatus ainarchaeum sp.]|nr:SGNH/GDSL hydrolase family protein [Candidatus ainarchaeum sp.]
MARVTLRGNELVIQFSGGATKPTGVTINRDDSVAAITSQIEKAKTAAKGFAMGLGKSAELTAINSKAEANRIYGGLHAVGAKTEEKAEAPKAPKKEPETKPAPQKKEKPVTEAKKPKAEEPKPPKKEEEKKLEKKHEKPQPRISVLWIKDKLSGAGKSDRKGSAATTLHMNSAYLDLFLSAEGQRGIERTPQQRDATVAVFNALAQGGKFRYNLVQAASENPAFPEFAVLEKFFGDPGKAWKLSPEADPEVILAVDMFIRYYFLSVAAGTDNGYREELNQAMGWRLENVEGIKALKIKYDSPEEHRAAIMKLYLTGPMDSETLTAAALYLRREDLEEKVKNPSQIEAWKAPEITPVLPSETEVAPPEAVTEAPAEEGLLAVRGRVGIIGDSVTAGSATKNRSYVDLLITGSPDATIGKYGVSGNTTSQMRKRFDKEILGQKPPYDVVVIQGGVNDIASGIPLTTTKANLSAMFKAAQDKGMQVVVFTIAPWGGSDNWNSSAQQKTDEFNKWLLAQDGKGITVVDLSSMRDGDSPKMKTDYDSGDHLHPNKDGQLEIARLAAERLSGVPLRKAPQTELEKFADANWKDLPTRIYGAARGGKPEEVMAIARTLPKDYATLPLALNELGRTDITDAFDMMFNDYLHQDKAFLDFASGRKNYAALANPAVRLSPSSNAAERRFAAEAVQDFIRYIAERTDDPAYAKFKEDIRVLSKAVLGLKGDELVKDGIPDLRTIAAVAVYTWRKAHMEAAAGEWTKKIPNVTIPQGAQQPAPEQKKKERTVLEL